MRTPVGSSKIVARSFAQSSPGCEPIGVIFTFWALAGATARSKARAAPACRVFIFCSSGLSGSTSRDALALAVELHHTSAEGEVTGGLQLLQERRRARSRP